eukprot:TRINITY_DN54069_c0_g1_i1.p1 TRINITY_DN54069_c0_g1~~TRINITY_DN54069_c0_g1_i1.p1  ORF type:complete len:749 (+),score=183.20 TRINITY_DN54069_c0_g1_i1:94-2340(+)
MSENVSQPVFSPTIDESARVIQRKWRNISRKKAWSKLVKSVIALQSRIRGQRARKRVAEISRHKSDEDDFMERQKSRQKRIAAQQSQLQILNQIAPERIGDFFQIVNDKAARKIQRFWKAKRRENMREKITRSTASLSDKKSLVASGEEDIDLERFWEFQGKESDLKDDLEENLDTVIKDLLTIGERKTKLYDEISQQQFEGECEDMYNEWLEMEDDFNENAPSYDIDETLALAEALESVKAIEDIENQFKIPSEEDKISDMFSSHVVARHRGWREALGDERPWWSVFAKGANRDLRSFEDEDIWDMTQTEFIENSMKQESLLASASWKAKALAGIDYENEALPEVRGDYFARLVHNTRIEVRDELCKMRERIIRENKRTKKLEDVSAKKIQNFYREKKLRQATLQKERQRREREAARIATLCHECIEAVAVLRCSECTDSRQFCPQCWTHTHSTAKRRHHKAIPIPQNNNLDHHQHRQHHHQKNRHEQKQEHSSNHNVKRNYSTETNESYPKQQQNFENENPYLYLNEEMLQEHQTNNSKNSSSSRRTSIIGEHKFKSSSPHAHEAKRNDIDVHWSEVTHRQNQNSNISDESPNKSLMRRPKTAEELRLSLTSIESNTVELTNESWKINSQEPELSLSPSPYNKTASTALGENNNNNGIMSPDQQVLSPLSRMSIDFEKNNNNRKREIEGDDRLRHLKSRPRLRRPATVVSPKFATTNPRMIVSTKSSSSSLGKESPLSPFGDLEML